MLDFIRIVEYNVVKHTSIGDLSALFAIEVKMLTQSDIRILGKVFSDYGYVMTTAQLTAEKLFYRDIQRMLEQSLIEKVRRWYYHWINDYGVSEVIMIKRLFPNAVLCMETALFYYQYSYRTHAEWNIAIGKNASRQRLKIDYPLIKAYLVEPSLLSLGGTEGEIDFEKVRICDRDRTICDVLRNMNRMAREIISRAIQRYVKDSKKSIPNLIQYARVLRVQKKVEDLVGMWL